MEQEKKGMSKGAKIGIGCLGLIVLFVIIGIFASDGSKNANTDKASSPTTTTNSTGNTDGNAQVTAQPTAKEKITLSNATAKQNYGYWGVVGEAKNNDTTVHSFTLKATFYDAEGKIVGTAVGAVNDLEPGDTKTYDLASIDKFSTYKELKVQIDTLVQ